MGGKTKVSGTAYDMSPATVKVGGTAYKVQYGNTKIDGTKYKIPFSPLPSEYQEVSYIKSTDTTNYIKLPIQSQGGMIAHYWCYMSSDIPVSSTTGYLCSWGHHSSTSKQIQKAYLYHPSDTGNWSMHANEGGIDRSLPVSLADNTAYEVTVKFSSRSPQITINFNGTKREYSVDTPFSAGKDLYLWRPAGSGSGYASRGCFGRFTITREADGYARMDLYPCVRKSDNEVGFWDDVSKTFLVNEGSGTLIAVP